MTKRSSTYLKGISETGDIANQTLFEDLIDSMGVVDEETTFDDSGSISITKDATYSTTRTVTGSSHTLTFATSGNVIGKSILVLYTFDVDCTLTLTNLNTTFSTLGQTDPISAGTYPFWFFVNPLGTISLVIQNATAGTTPTTLTTPTLVLSVGNTQAGYVITNIDANATAGVLEYSTDNVNWTTWGSYSFGTETGTITGLTNGVLYYGRYRNTASGYNSSGYATDTVTPSAGVTQLTQPTGLTSVPYNSVALLEFDAIDANADSVSIQRSLSSGSGFSTIDTIARTNTSYADTTYINGTTYYYRIIANGSGSYSNSDPSAESSVDWAVSDFDTDLALWLNGVQGITQAGLGISIWSDQSGNGRDFAQTTDANRPSFGTREVIFDSAGPEFFDGASGATDWVKDFHDGTVTTYEILVKAYNNQAASSAIIGTNGASASALGFTWYFRDTDKTMRHSVGNASVVVANVSDANIYTQGTTYQWFRLTGKVTDATPANRSVLYNESSSSANNTDSGTAGTGNATYAIQIGAAGNDLVPLHGAIKEIIVVNRALTAQEWTDIKAR